ncbi:MAG: hypothetical protein ACK5TK_06320 [Betaproteobacteria bacterium]
MRKPLPVRRSAIAALVLWPLAIAAQEAERRERRGNLTVIQWPLVEVSGKRLYAAPGARIVNANKLTVTPNMVAPGTRVTYELDGQGQIRVIRIAAP